MTATLPTAFAAQQPPWPDQELVSRVRASLATLPSLVFPGECDRLRSALAEVAAGRGFLLQGGDCAEAFADVTEEAVGSKLRTLFQMSVVLMYSAGVPVVRLGRMAGQYAKPRSADIEQRGTISLPSYRGEAVNGHRFIRAERIPDPTRMVDAYHAASATLNLIRAFAAGGYADLNRVAEWNADFVSTTPTGGRYQVLAQEVGQALRFLRTVGADPRTFSVSEMYVSHEALLMDYELPLVRSAPSGDRYLTSTHLPWIGERTRQLDGAHVEMLSAVANPIGVKVGPKATPAELLRLIDRLDPNRIPGRLTLITRMGHGAVGEVLPHLIRAVRQHDYTPLWVCDPMHGNTFTTPNGYKSRRFDDVLSEVTQFFAIHRAEGSWPGGVHVEFTGDDVTECIGGSQDILEDGLAARYETTCDPRLNRHQSLQLAFLVADELSRVRG